MTRIGEELMKAEVELYEKGIIFVYLLMFWVILGNFVYMMIVELFINKPNSF